MSWSARILSVEKGEHALFEQIRYFFYITNDELTLASEIVFLANDRCNQQNLIEQLKNGVQAFRVPVNSLVANWAYMVMASLAWTLKAWFARACQSKDVGRQSTRQRNRLYCGWSSERS